MSGPARNLAVTISGDPSSLLRAIKAAERGMGDMSKTSDKTSKTVEAHNTRTGASFTKMAKHAAAGALAVGGAYKAIEGVKNAVHATEELGKTTARLATNLGLTTKQASEFGAVAQSRNIDAKALGTGFTILSKATESATTTSKKHIDAIHALAFKQELALAAATRAAAGAKDQAKAEQGLVDLRAKQGIAMENLSTKTSKQQDAFKKLGITQDDLKKGSTDFNFLIGKVSDGLSGMEAGTGKVAVASAIFGKGYAQLLPLMNDGSKGLKEQTDLADKYGATLSGKTAKGLAELRKGQREQKIAQLGLRVQITQELLPTMLQLDKHALKLARAFAGPGSLSEKIARVGKVAAPAMQALKDEILKDIPQIASSVGKQAPKVAMAFVNGFLKADTWGKLAIGAFLLKRFGGMSSVLTLGKSIGTKLGVGMAEGQAVSAGLPGAAGGAGGAAARASRFGRFAPAAGGLAAGLTGAVAVAGGMKAASDAIKGNDFSDKGILQRYKKQLDDVAKSGDSTQMRNLAKNLRDAARANQDLTKGTNLKRVANDLDAAASSGVKFGQSTKPISQVDKYLQNLSPTARAVSKSFDGMEKSTGSVMDAVRANVATNADRIKSDLGSKSKAGKQALAANFAAASTAIQRAMDAGSVSTSKGMALIADYTSQALATFGITGKQASAFKAMNKAIGLNPVTFGDAPGNNATATGKAVGGWIGSPGQAGRDTVPAMLGVGEAVLNRHQQAPVETALRNTYGMGLDDLFAQVRQPHYLASGGRIPRVQMRQGLGAITTIGQGAIDTDRAAAMKFLDRIGGGAGTGGMLSFARRLESMRIPYGPQGHSGMAINAAGEDCSSSVSKVLHAGLGKRFAGVQTTVTLPGVLERGRGQHVTVHDRALPGASGHTIMEMNGRFFGTSRSNPGGGPGFFPTPSAGYLATLPLKLHPKGYASGGIVGAANAARRVGLAGSDAVTAVAIAGAESQWRPGAISPPNTDGSRDRGEWQINDVHHLDQGRLLDINYNAQAMDRISSHGKNWNPWTTYRTGAYRAFMDRARAAVVGTRGGPSGSSGGSSSASKSEVAAAARTHRAAVARKSTSRLLNSIIDPALHGTAPHIGAPGHAGFVFGTRGILATGGMAGRVATSIGDSDAAAGRVERLQGQSDEDLGTEAGRTKRGSELAELKKLKLKQVARQHRELQLLKQQEAKLHNLVKKLRATLVGKGRVRGAQAARVRERIAGFDNDLVDVQAAIKALNGTILDTKLDVGDIDKEIATTAATPNTAVDASGSSPGSDSSGSGSSSGDSGGNAGPDTAAADAARQLAEALAALRASVDRQNAFAESVTAVTGAEVARALADLMNGQIVGSGLRGRNATAGAGTVVRY